MSFVWDALCPGDRSGEVYGLGFDDRVPLGDVIFFLTPPGAHPPQEAQQILSFDPRFHNTRRDMSAGMYFFIK